MLYSSTIVLVMNICMDSGGDTSATGLLMSESLHPLMDPLWKLLSSRRRVSNRHRAKVNTIKNEIKNKSSLDEDEEISS